MLEPRFQKNIWRILALMEALAMNKLWNYIHEKKWNLENKITLFLFVTTLLPATIGFFIWFILHFFVLNKITWALCFIGYPGYFIGLLGGILYLYRHNF